MGARSGRRRRAITAALLATVVSIPLELAAADRRPMHRHRGAPSVSRALPPSRPGMAPGGPAGPPPLGAAGPPPLGAAGPPPLGAAGPPPLGAAGPPPLGATAGAPRIVEHEAAARCDGGACDDATPPPRALEEEPFEGDATRPMDAAPRD